MAVWTCPDADGSVLKSEPLENLGDCASNAKMARRLKIGGRAKDRRRAIETSFLVPLLSLLLVARAAEPAVPPQLVDLRHTVGWQTAAFVRIVNGSPTTWFPSVGALLHRDRGRFIMHCSGTLISCDAFLTAAHCVQRDTSGANYKVYLQHGGLFDVRKVDYPKGDYRAPDAKVGSRSDVAVLRLTRPVEGIAPHRINEDREQALGSASTIVGFGQTAATDFNAGLKRFGAVISSSCPDGFLNSEMVCWRYAPSEGANTCNADSGGPMILKENREVVSGVTSDGIDRTCTAFDRAYDASVYRNRAWIKSASDLIETAAQCGQLASFDKGDIKSRYDERTGQINDEYPQHRFELSVKNVTRLRVGANFARPKGLEGRPFVDRPELYILRGNSQDLHLDLSLCPPTPNNQAVFCEVKSPADDFYTIILRRGGTTGTADFQLAVSVY
jgi:hypothetical protein